MNTEEFFKAIFWTLLLSMFLMRFWFGIRVWRTGERILADRDAHQREDLWALVVEYVFYLLLAAVVREGVFGRVVPHNSVHFRRDSCGGRRAWQIGCRLSHLDLTNADIVDGQITDMTLGLNWFLNPNMKIQGNYLLANRDGQQGQESGWFNGLGVCAAWDF